MRNQLVQTRYMMLDSLCRLEIQFPAHTKNIQSRIRKKKKHEAGAKGLRYVMETVLTKGPGLK